MLDILIAGHCTHDIIVLEDKEFFGVGGGPPCISRLFESLNLTARDKEGKERHAHLNYAIISKVGPDFKYFSELPQRPSVVTRPTTCFVNRFRSDEIVAREVRSICEPIFPRDVQSECKICLISGVIGEVLPKTIERLSSCCKVIFCDVQGLTRQVDRLGRINYLKLNASESQFVEVKDISRKTIVLLTKGKDGCSIIEKGKEFELSTRPVPEEDPSGAGDFFVGGFAYGVLKNYSLEKCAQVANYCGGLAVVQVGIPTKIKIKESFI